MIAATRLAADFLLAQSNAPTPPTWRLRWDWSWPLWMTVLVSVAVVAWVTTIYLRESSTASTAMRLLLALLRLTALTLAMLMFAQPAVEWFRQAQPRLVVLVDRSGSMSTLDRYPGATEDITRADAWQNLLTGGEQPLLAEWQVDYELDVIAFGEQIEQLDDSQLSMAEQLQSLDLESNETGGTRLGDAIDYALRELSGTQPVAIVVLTDGIATHGQSLAAAAGRARQLHVPLFTVAIGSERRRPDIAVSNMLVEEVVFPGDRLQVEATVRAVGFAGKRVEAVLRDETGCDLARTTITLPVDGSSESVRLAIRPEQPGKLALELAIEPLAEELTPDNNTLKQIVEVSDERIRVLLVQSQPSYEYRALKSLLERDPAVELRVVLQEADADYPTVDATAIRGFPANEKELFEYDVLLLGDVDPAMLPRSVWPLVERFVTDHGGGLVGIAGPRFMPSAFRGIRLFESLLPMELRSLNPLRSQLEEASSIAIAPTALGRRTPSLQLGESQDESQRIWQKLPDLSWMLRLDDVKPGTQILAAQLGVSDRQGRPWPAILRHYVGAGEVLFHATDETWRWRWRTDDRYFARYWGQVVRRLGRGRLAAGRRGIQLTSDRSQYEPGEAVQLMARFRNSMQAPTAEDGVVVQLQGMTGPARQLTLQRRLGRRGLFSTRVEDLPSGEYEAQLVRPARSEAPESARFAIRQPPREQARVVINRQGLSEAAATSGGKFYRLAEASRLAEELPLPRQQSIDEMPTRQLWNSNALVALFVLVLASEWLLRRRFGML